MNSLQSRPRLLLLPPLLFLSLLSCNIDDPTLCEDARERQCSPCAEYCVQIAQNCPHLYSGPYECMEMCKTWEEGDLEDPNASGNNLACRLQAARALNPEVDECPRAGPLAVGCDGTGAANYERVACETLCGTLEQLCPASFATYDSTSDALGDDLRACMSDCAQLQVIGTGGRCEQDYDTTGACRTYLEDESTPANVQCRFYHLDILLGLEAPSVEGRLEKTATDPPAEHCLHAIGSAPPGKRLPCAIRGGNATE